jgi:hypothetical protein
VEDAFYAFHAFCAVAESVTCGGIEGLKVRVHGRAGRKGLVYPDWEVFAFEIPPRTLRGEKKRRSSMTAGRIDFPDDDAVTL